jgi:hypothetical protein
VSRDDDAKQAGIDSRADVRQALIDWRDAAMANPNPSWDGIALLTHAIWWLASENETAESQP